MLHSNKNWKRHPAGTFEAYEAKLGEKMLLFYVMQSSKSLGRVWVTVWTSTYMNKIPFTKSTKEVELMGEFQALRMEVRIN